MLVVYSTFEELKDRQIHETKESKILSYFKPSIFATEDDKPWLLTLKQAVTENAYIAGVWGVGERLK